MNASRIDETPRQLMACARELAGVDILDVAIEERLARLLDSLNTEARLSEAGARLMRFRLLRWLRNRLRMLRDVAAHPEIRAQRIERPLVLLGLPRTASTKLHHLLAASGDFQYQPFWRGHNLGLVTGDRHEDPAGRIREAGDFIAMLYARVPEMQVAHPYATFAPEEETMIFEHLLGANTLFPYLNITGYLAWFRSQDPRPDVEFFKLGLQYLQWQFGEGDARPWLLKSPGHAGREHVIAELFPGARFVSTVRDPLDVCSSGASLVTCFHRTYSDEDWSRMIGPRFLDGFAMQAQRHLAVRDAHPEIDFLDVGYTGLTRQPERAVERIYAHACLPLTDTARAAMRGWEHENRQHKLGVHRHSLEDYGLTPAMVTEKFRDYIDRFHGIF